MEQHNARIDALLSEPREALDVEVKTWLDLSNNDHRAIVAKEVIALANHGGGYVVIGFEELDDGSFMLAAPRPANLNAWSQDAIQSIIAKYVDPTVQCAVVHKKASGEVYPVIVVPGGHRVPIRAKSGSPDGKLAPHRVYVRRPGPCSEEPKTAEEWDRLLERCLQSRQAELLEAMRSIIAGIVPTAVHAKTPSRIDELREFERLATKRWKQRVALLPEGTAPKFPHGHYDVGIAIDGKFNVQPLTELRRIIERAVRNHSGWPPFLTLSRVPYRPKPVDGAVETWIGPDNDGSYDAPAHHDFWRIAPSGEMFTRRGYQEDGGVKGMEPGRFFDITSPTWRLGEAILEGVYVARALEAVDANLIVDCRWVGLSARSLTSVGNATRILTGNYHCQQDAYDARIQTVSLDALPAALPELVYSIVAPLYELFDFFQLSKRLVEQELASLQRNTFAS